MKMLHLALGAAAMTLMVLAGTARAQVPADIAAGLKKIGQIVDPACTAKLYRPLMPANDVNSKATPLYKGIDVARDVSFGPNAERRHRYLQRRQARRLASGVDLCARRRRATRSSSRGKDANAFYDNIMRWATKNGMVGVNMQRHPGQGNWDDGGKDVSRMIQWLQANISKYKGDPERMFIWAHSAGNGPLGTYVGRPELYGPKAWV